MNGLSRIITRARASKTKKLARTASALLGLMLVACTDEDPNSPSEPSSGAASEGATADASDASTTAGTPLPGESSSGGADAATHGTTETGSTSGGSVDPSSSSSSSSGDGQDDTEGVAGPCEPVAGEELPVNSPCDPLASSCAATMGCYYQVDGCPFQCIPTWGDGLGVGDECLYLNDCSPGLVCTDAALFSACQGTYCCTSYCDLDAPSCPGTSTCEPYWAPGTAPAGFEHVGLCIGV